MCGLYPRMGHWPNFINFTQFIHHPKTKKCSLSTTLNLSSRTDRNFEHEPHPSQTSQKLYANRMPYQLSSKFLQTQVPKNRIRTFTQDGSAAFWILLLILLSSALAMVGLGQILKSHFDLKHMQDNFACAYAYSKLVQKKWKKITALTKTIIMTRRAELAAKAIPLPSSQATARMLEFYRLTLEKWQNGQIIMAQAIFMKFQIKGCRAIQKMHGPPLSTQGQKILRHPIHRNPILKNHWKVCIEHKGHGLWLDHKTQKLPSTAKLKIKSTYGLPCSKLMGISI